MNTPSRRLARWSALAAAALTASGLLVTASAAQIAPLRPAVMRDTALARHTGGSCFLKEKLAWIGSAYLVGYSNATKLGESALVGRGPSGQPRAGFQGVHNWYAIANACNGNFYQYLTGVLDYHGRTELPPARTTFLSFGFAPTTATLELVEMPLRAGCRDVLHHQIAPPPVYTCIIALNTVNNAYTVSVASSVEIHVLSVTVNGTPLRVGPACRTAKPFPLMLTGDGQKGYNVLTGGPLTGKFTIGGFTGCGVSDNLNPLFDSSLSGVSNLVKLTQGPTCAKFTDPPLPPNANCLVGPGAGHPWGIPKHIPIPLR